MTVLIMILLWVLQLLLLNIIYGWTTRSRMQSLLYEIAYVAGEEDFEERSLVLAENAQTGMAIYRVEGDIFTLWASAEEKGGVSHLLDSAHIQELYGRTLTEEGFFQDKLDSALEQSHFPNDAKQGRLLSALVTTTTAGATYFILLDTALTPLRSLFFLMQNQLSIVSLILLAVSAGIAFLLARHIASPIERISGKAKRMSRGELAIDFSDQLTGLVGEFDFFGIPTGGRTA